VIDGPPAGGSTEPTKCCAVWPAAARIADVSLLCLITTPTAVSPRPATVTWVKNARHPPAAESDPVVSADPSAISGLKLVSVPAIVSVTLGIETIRRNTGKRIACSRTRSWSAAVETVLVSNPLGSV
jgi:hypothetical protein